MVRIVHFRAKCIGCNACVEAANYRWRISRKDGKSTLIGSIETKGIYSVLVGNEEYQHALSALKHCPVNIIKIEKIL